MLISVKIHKYINCRDGWWSGYPLDCYDYYSTCGANNTCDELKDGWQLWFLWASSATAWSAHIDLWKSIRYWTLEANKKHIDHWKKALKLVVLFYCPPLLPMIKKICKSPFWHNKVLNISKHEADCLKKEHSERRFIKRMGDGSTCFHISFFSLQKW